ncbi:hypothetical protein [Chryseobacterium indoltheticum]|uniref:hypothetical protein n=1 Tax=Chryseobacterium indoltheticum TaxID=254 RepID=UPI003F492DDF
MGTELSHYFFYRWSSSFQQFYGENQFVKAGDPILVYFTGSLTHESLEECLFLQPIQERLFRVKRC